MKFQLTLVASVAFYIVSAGNFCFGQSTVIGSENAIDPSGSSFSVRTPLRDYSVPSSLSSQRRHWESILDRPATGLLNRIDYCEELIARLRELGLPVFLDQSAIDDSLPFDEEIEISYDGVSLRAVLTQTLGSFNATIAFREDRILIISLDIASDNEHLETIVYDVSSIVRDPTELKALSYHMRDTVSPDEWDGGTGAGTVTGQMISGRCLISIHQNAAVHRQVQTWLSSLNKMKGRSLPAEMNLAGDRRGSTVVSSRSQSDITQPEVGRGISGGGFGGGGIGGFGGGGGIF